MIWILILIAVIIIGVISAFMSFRYGYAYRKNFAELKIGSAEEEAERILNDAAAAAEKDAENIKKELGIRSYRRMRQWYWSIKPEE